MRVMCIDHVVVAVAGVPETVDAQRVNVSRFQTFRGSRRGCDEGDDDEAVSRGEEMKMPERRRFEA